MHDNDIGGNYEPSLDELLVQLPTMELSLLQKHYEITSSLVQYHRNGEHTMQPSFNVYLVTSKNIKDHYKQSDADE